MFTTPPVIVEGSLGSGPQPTLSVPGELLLRPWETADAPVFFEAYQDPAIRRWHTWNPVSVDDVLTWFAQYRQDWAAERGGLARM